MNGKLLRKAAIAVTAAAFTTLFAGCATGYITSSINTGIGLDVSENPQTQVPHVKLLATAAAKIR